MKYIHGILENKKKSTEVGCTLNDFSHNFVQNRIR